MARNKILGVEADRILFLRKQGLTYLQIALRLGRSESVVMQWINRSRPAQPATPEPEKTPRVLPAKPTPPKVIVTPCPICARPNLHRERQTCGRKECADELKARTIAQAALRRQERTPEKLVEITSSPWEGVRFTDDPRAQEEIQYGPQPSKDVTVSWSSMGDAA